MLVVLDTNVLVSAIRSKRGASFAILSQLGGDAFEVAVSVPLVVEYEAVMIRNSGSTRLDEEDVRDIIDYVCSVARLQPIYFLWRPLLKDPSDDMVAEVAVAGGCDAVVTHNGRVFDALAQLGVRVVSPKDFLEEIGRSR